MDLITVVIPVYNAQKHIDRTLQSICGQTYENLQILLIDDGSADNSLALCREWEKKDKRIRVYTQENSGVSKTRNRGIALAGGKYLMFMDADDWAEPDMIRSLYELAEKDKADVSCCVLCEESVQQAERADITAVHEKAKSRIVHGKNKAESGLALLSVWGPVCKLYRTDLIAQMRFEEYEVAEDLLFNTNVICSEQFKRASLIPYPFYHYVIYEGSAMKQEFQEKYLEAMKVEEMCYEKLTKISPEFADINLIGCSVSRVFEKYAALSSKKRKLYKKQFRYAKQFAKEHKEALLHTKNRHRKISGWLKVYVPDLYLQTLAWRMRG